MDNFPNVQFGTSYECNELMCYKWVIIEGIKYCRGSVVNLTSESINLKFAKVECITSSNGKVRFRVFLYDASYYNEHLSAYAVHGLSCISVELCFGQVSAPLVTMYILDNLYVANVGI